MAQFLALEPLHVFYVPSEIYDNSVHVVTTGQFFRWLADSVHPIKQTVHIECLMIMKSEFKVMFKTRAAAVLSGFKTTRCSRVVLDPIKHVL